MPVTFYNNEFIKFSNALLGQKKPDSESTPGDFIPIEPKYKPSQVVLNEELVDEISYTLKIIENIKIIYDEWEFGEVDPMPKAILNFYGPPGTGKTMTAHAIASKLGVKILAANYAEIESKFVGDAPKNLIKAFETANTTNALLFFDEADSFLGKRITSVSTGCDQAVNSLRSQMLILLENISGIVIFATNLMRNYDRAFESRIFKHIKFGYPNRTNRKKIIQITTPPRAPIQNGEFTDEQLNQLVEISEGFSGRDIKNAVLDALAHAVINRKNSILFEDFLMAFESQQKNKRELDAIHNQQ
ncbi:MAG: AAA family ATPase [Proteobacteria bacterium]|nr:AAA family ATPase [Pseudomonadota bacterium]